MHTFTLPSGIEIELVEVTGVEKDLLTNRRLMKKGEGINQVLANCTKRLGETDGPKIKDILDLLSRSRLATAERALGCPSLLRPTMRRGSLTSSAAASRHALSENGRAQVWQACSQGKATAASCGVRLRAACRHLAGRSSADSAAHCPHSIAAPRRAGRQPVRHVMRSSLIRGLPAPCGPGRPRRAGIGVAHEARAAGPHLVRDQDERVPYAWWHLVP
ncbi:MAG: hypothetical protein ACOC8A_00710 [bacterium]